MDKQEIIDKKQQEIVNKLFPLLDELSEMGNKYKCDFGYGKIEIKFKIKASKYHELDEYDKSIIDNKKI